MIIWLTPHREIATIHYGNQTEHLGGGCKSLLNLNLVVHILTTKFKPQNWAQNLTLTSASDTQRLLNVSDSNMI